MTKDKEGRTPFHLAAYKGGDKVATLLIEREAAINAKDKDDNTSLQVAAEMGHHAVICRLSEQQGVDKKVKNNVGDTPLHLAASSGREGAVEYLIKEGGQ